jgi:hypothetical protein
VQSTGAGNFLSDEVKDELWVEFSRQQMEEAREQMMMEDQRMR